MTVQDVANFVDHVGNGIATSFPFVFRADDVSWVTVDFTTDIIGVTLNADQDTTPGGTVDYTVAPPNLQAIRIQRDTPQAQNLDYTRYDPFDSESHEDALDKLTMEVQDLLQASAEAVADLQAQINAISPTTLPVGTVPNSILRWDNIGLDWDEFLTYIFPLADGAAGQVIETDGAGALSFATPAVGIVPPSTVLNSTLRGDGVGAWVEQTILKISAAGTLITDAGILSSDGIDAFSFSTFAGVTTFVGTGGMTGVDYLGPIWNWNDIIIERPHIRDYSIAVVQFSIIANAVTVDLELANACVIDIDDVGATADFTVTLSNPPANGRYGEILIDFIQGTPAFNAIWPGSVRWPGGTPPVISVTNNARDTVHLWTRDGGTTWFGSFLQDYS